jgi:oxygen-independent coproporphyrinogen-3 oxidase
MNAGDLIRKYDIPVPRYTSYPTVPCWDEEKFSIEAWWDAVIRCFKESNQSKGISIYIHLPFCESLCTYCACNTRITKNHSVEEKYLQVLLKEWNIYRSRFHETPVIRELHLGGGTPTFFSPENLSRLVTGLIDGCAIHPSREFSFEGHPNNTTFAHLLELYKLGFERVSFGVQDLDPKVQKAINRIQPLTNLQSSVQQARSVGYKSIGFDLIYGLPYQTPDSVTDTINQVIRLKPDRIAFYSYAHVPWLRPGQRGYEDADLPTDVCKRSLYEEGRKYFLQSGYIDIGMDHFSSADDSLALAHRQGKLHRNFMGYTTNQTELLIGLGTSSISDAKYAYAQNAKKVEEYTLKIFEGNLAIFKGHLQTAEDLTLRKFILDITCRGRVCLSDHTELITEDMREVLTEMSGEGIIEFSEMDLTVTEKGRPFIRNIASVFDNRMRKKSITESTFSKAI